MFATFSETPLGDIAIAIGSAEPSAYYGADQQHIEDVLVVLADAGVEARFAKQAEPNPWPRYLPHHFAHAAGRAMPSGSARLFIQNEGC